MKGNKKKRLTDDELKECELFKQHRLKYRKTQKEWAEAIGISLALVKKIEACSIRCSPKTGANVRKYLKNNPISPYFPVLHGLDERVLYETFLTRMLEDPDMDSDEASRRASDCGKLVARIFSNASDLEQGCYKRKYFHYIEHLLTVLSAASDNAVAAIKDNKDILNADTGLRAVFTKAMLKNCGNILISKDGSVSIQTSIEDVF